MVDVLIVFALDEELRHAYSFLEQDGGTCDEKYDHGTYAAYQFHYEERHSRTWTVLIQTVRAQGNLDVATSVQPIIAREKPIISIMAGIAGSLDRTAVDLGDVVVGTSVKMMSPDGYKTARHGKEIFSDEIGKPEKGVIVVDARDRLMSKTFLRHRRRWMYREESYTALSAYMAETRKSPLTLEPLDVTDREGVRYQNPTPKLVSATLVGSEFVVDSQEVVDLMHERNSDRSKDYYVQKNDPEDLKRITWRDDELKSVDMESFGFFLAYSKVAQPQSHAFAVRGISDRAMEKADLDGKTGGAVRALAARNATAVALDLATYLRKNRLKPS